jgi:hypothetical protein
LVSQRSTLMKRLHGPIAVGETPSIWDSVTRV